MPNGSFEEYSCCPQQVGDLHCVQEWFSPTLTTPDYYNFCSQNGQSGVPLNAYGSQFAQDGNAYVGINLNADDGYREYIGVKLLEKMEKGGIYIFEFYVCSSKLTDYPSNNFEILFLTDTVDFEMHIMNSGTPIILNTNSIKNPNIISDSINWTKINGTYISNGCEEFVLFGNFKSQNETSFGTNGGNGIDSYYYIDNVSIKKDSYSFFPPLTNVFSPNGDGINDFFELINFNIESFTILNRWGNVIYYSSTEMKWDGTLNGLLCKEGVYFYRITIINCNGQQEEKTGFFHLIR